MRLIGPTFAHAGVIRTDTVAESFDVAAQLAGQPVPRGARVAILTTAGGLPSQSGADRSAERDQRVRCDSVA